MSIHFFIQSIKEEKKERLQNDIDEIRRKEGNKENDYMELMKKSKKY
jgi:low affinity Fe/Cu permease